MMTRIARGWLGLALVAALLAYGGAGDLVQPLLTVAIAIAAVLAAAGLRQEFHCPPLGWIAWLFLPPLALALLQVLPLGWHHPWISEDARLLGVTPTAWSIDPSASTAVLVWFATLAGLALTVCLLARGDRVQIHQRVVTLELFLQAHPVLEGAEVISEREPAGRLDARQHNVFFANTVAGGHQSAPAVRPRTVAIKFCAMASGVCSTAPSMPVAINTTSLTRP